MRIIEGSSAFAMAAALSIGIAYAQDVSAGADTTTSNGGLEEVVVTAQRTQENLQDAPIAVDVVSAEAIQNAAVSNPAQLTTLVPALQVANTNGSYSNFYIRGVGNFTGNALTESAVAFNYDGVYIARPSSTVGFFYDLSRVEVLKGPQGTLYGRNATGGAINVIPQAPTLEQGGFITASIGDYNAYNVQAAINVPVTDQAAFRLSGIINQHDGYMEDGTDDADDVGSRAQFRLDATPELSIVLGADYFSQGGKGVGGTPSNLGVDNRYGAFSPQNDAYFAGLLHVIGGDFFPALPDIQFQDNEYWGANATIVYESGIGNFTIVPAYRHSSIDYTTGNIGFFIMQKEEFEQESIEARYETPADQPVRALLGAYYFSESGEDPYNIINNVFGRVDQINQRYGTDSWAAFGRFTYDITPDVHLTAGLRYTHEERTFSGQSLSLVRSCLTGFGACIGTNTPFENTTDLPPFTPIPNDPSGAVVPDFVSYGSFPFEVGQFGNFTTQNKEASFNHLTWRAGVDWDLTDENMLYASFETGFKSGGFFVTIDPGVYQPETIDAWTIGSKNRFLDNRLQVNLEAFYWTYEDQQISHLGIDSLGTLVFPTENVGASTVQGAEVEVQYLLTPDTLLSADVQYLDSAYDDFVYIWPAAGGTPQSGCVLTPIAGGTSVDCSGQRPPQAPELVLNLGLSQTFGLSNGARLVFDGRAHYQTETWTGLEYLPAEQQDGYWTADLQLAYHDPSDRFSLTGFVNNVTDETVIGQTFLATYAISPAPFATLHPPRTYGVRIGYEF